MVGPVNVQIYNNRSSNQAHSNIRSRAIGASEMQEWYELSLELLIALLAVYSICSKVLRFFFLVRIRASVAA